MLIRKQSAAKQPPTDATTVLAALRTEAAANADAASLPRIDAMLAALEPSAGIADAHWKRALAAMIASDARPGDVATLLRALGSPYVLPPPVDDNVVVDMRAYAHKVLSVTEDAITNREVKRP